MIDYLKILVTDMRVWDYFLNHEKLVFVRQIKRSDQEYDVITKEYKGITFVFHEKCLWIYFKPHYFFNDNLHNSNDFTVYDCIGVLSDFLEVFREVRKELLECPVINLEFGVNVISPIYVKELLDSILYHGKNLFRIQENLPYSKISSKIRQNGKANDYKMIKAYAKGLQVFPGYDNQHHPNTFRFEVKSKQSKYINRLGIKIFGDLLNLQIYETLADHILI
ncbi:hypothetical protein ACFSJT_04330 [Aquimarina celericrescens]|uniref:Uncharacterized protein n=2 Tax=Aquimarina celericrescens TaxID=1964542 RepID=A0ABW5AV74_9FLAO|nr:hypothetical protein [Aquimarina celericrescens]